MRKPHDTERKEFDGYHPSTPSASGPRYGSINTDKTGHPSVPVAGGNWKTGRSAFAWWICTEHQGNNGRVRQFRLDPNPDPITPRPTVDTEEKRESPLDGRELGAFLAMGMVTSVNEEPER